MEHYYPAFLTLHLFGAVIFGGAVFFEVLILESVRKHFPSQLMASLEIAIGKRARMIMPWAMLMLYGGGIGMALARYLPVLSEPLASSFATLLWIKIVLASSVLCHFLTAMYLLTTNKMNSTYFKIIHLSVFSHVMLIIFLAKAMFYWTW